MTDDELKRIESGATLLLSDLDEADLRAVLRFILDKHGLTTIKQYEYMAVYSAFTQMKAKLDDAYSSMHPLATNINTMQHLQTTIRYLPR